jgi:hypothetical protein
MKPKSAEVSAGFKSQPIPIGKSEIAGNIEIILAKSIF